MIGTWVVMLTLLLVLLGLFELPQSLWRLYRQYRELCFIPGMPRHWFWGNIKQLKLDQETVKERISYVQQGGHKIVKLWFSPFKPVLVIAHCSLVKTVIKLPKDFFSYSFLVPWFGDGLATADKRWFRNRRLITPAFHYNILRGYVPVINRHLKILIQKWIASAKADAPVYTVRDLSKMTLDILMQCAFSSETNNQGLPSDHPYVTAVNDLILLIDERLAANNPMNFLDFFYYQTPEGKKFKQACKIAHTHTHSVVKERKRLLGLDSMKLSDEEKEKIMEQAKSGNYLNFIDILLFAQDEEGNGMTEDEIRDEADTFMSAHHTTTNALAVTLYCLAQHPEHQEKIREEVKNILMGREWLEYDDLKELKYTTWCIKEARRLYPPVSKAVRITTEDTNMDGHTVPKDTTIVLDITLIHRHPDTWDNPNEYDPLRFHPTNTVGRHPYAYIPFSAGGHNCIGQNFAFKEERIIISTIISRFHISLDETQEVKILLQNMLNVDRTMKLKLKPVV